MNSLDQEQPEFTRPPVIPSHLSAEQQFRRWVEENNLRTITDHDGLIWDLAITLGEKPNQDFMEIHVTLTTHPTPDFLVKAGTLDRQLDNRLINLLGMRSIPLRLGPLTFRVDRKRDIEQQLLDIIPPIRKRFKEDSYREVKRKLIGQWIDSRRAFALSHLR